MVLVLIMPIVMVSIDYYQSLKSVVTLLQVHARVFMYATFALELEFKAQH